jgi:hypothetical protein
MPPHNKFIFFLKKGKKNIPLNTPNIGLTPVQTIMNECNAALEFKYFWIKKVQPGGKTRVYQAKESRHHAPGIITMSSVLDSDHTAGVLILIFAGEITVPSNWEG